MPTAKTEKIRLDEKTHTYWLRETRIPGFSEICADLGISKPNPFYTEEGREEGTMLHKWLLFLAQGKKAAAPPDPRIAGRVAGIEKFLRDTNFKIIGGEIAQYDPVTRVACTPDLWGYNKTGAWVIDGKRGAKLPMHRLQTACQKICLAANGFNAKKRGSLYLKNGDYRLDDHTDRDDETRWRQIVAAYYAKKEYE